MELIIIRKLKTKQMKNKIFFLLTLTFSIAGTAQFSALDYKSKEFAQFKASKMHVVLSGDKKYDEEIKTVMNELWKVTPFDFIGPNEVDAKISEKESSFMLLLKIETGKPNQNYHYLSIINGGQKKITRYAYADLISYCPINFYQNENNLSSCYFRLRNMIQSMIMSMDIVQKNDIKGNTKKIVDGLQEVYNTKAPKIKERTLLFCEDMIGPKLSKADLAGLYPNKFEICSKEKIAKAIKDKSTEYYYFQPAITLNKSMFVFDPATGEVMYFDYNMMGLNINKGNIEDFVKIVNPKKK